MTKPGSLERSYGWFKIADNFSQVERPKFGVSFRAVRDASRIFSPKESPKIEEKKCRWNYS